MINNLLPVIDHTEIDGYTCFAPDLATQNDGFDAEAFSILFGMESNYFWFTERNKIILWAIQKYFPKIKNFLEIGCGTGYVTSFLQNNLRETKIYGSEIYVEGLKHASRRIDSSSLFQMDATSIPFKETFDMIGMFDVLEHIQEDELVLQNIYQALNPGGGLILTVPQHQFLWSQSDDYAHHKRRYARKELKKKLVTASFKTVFAGSFVSLLMPALLLSRLLAKPQKEFDPQKEFQISRVLNTIFGMTLQFELMLMKANISLPFGGSLLLVAQKV